MPEVREKSKLCLVKSDSVELLRTKIESGINILNNSDDELVTELQLGSRRGM